MNQQHSTEDTARKAEILRGLHAGPGLLVLPNAWDASSAKAVEAAGFPVVATTSSGVSAALGFGDGQKAPRDEMLAAAARIVNAVSVPVTVDFEAGYDWSPQEVVEKLIGIGAVGMNIEDTNHNGATKLVDAEGQAERLAAIKAAGRAAGVDLVLNARVDTFVSREGTLEEQVTEGLRRARLYKQAGADCIYPIILGDEAAMAEFVKAVGTINMNARRGGALSLERAAAIGIRRISYAGSVYREAITATEASIKAIQAEREALS